MNKKKRVLVVENLETHAPLVATYMTLLNRAKNTEALGLITTKNYKIIQKDFPEFFNLNKKNIFRFDQSALGFRKIAKLIEFFKNFIHFLNIIRTHNVDTIILDTPESKKNSLLMLYFLFSRKKIILTHHDSLFDKNLGKFYIWLYKKAIKKSNASVFLGDYLVEHEIFSKKKKLYMNYVYDFWKPRNKISKYNKTTFVLNSHPKIQNRDYKMLFESFAELLEETPALKEKISIIIPLRISSPEILDLINKNRLGNIVKIFDKYVLESEFRQILRKSHYSIVPLYPEAKSGTSRIAATISYNCAFELPTIISKNYFRNAKSSPDYAHEYDFNKESLKKTLKELSNKKYSEKLVRQQFKKYSQEQNPNSVSKKLKKLI